MSKYYKAFKPDLTCRGFQYVEGETFEVEGELDLCGNGLHFCKDLVLTLDYYPIKRSITENKYAEVELLGDVVWDEPTRHKGCTNKLKIVRVLLDSEVLAMVDKSNNSGNRNSGNRNSGDWNSGDSNSGDCNSGDSNSGYSNSGYRNSGNSNSGNRNSGDWNSGSRHSGAFCTGEPDTILVFDKPCSLRDWRDAYKPEFLYFNPGKDYKKSFVESWDKADKQDRERVRELPCI